MVKRAAKTHAKPGTKHTAKHRAPPRPRTARPIVAATPAASRAFVQLCANCGSTRLSENERITACADCHSTQILTVPQRVQEATQNKILEHQVEEKFHSYMEEKHKHLALRRFLGITLAVVAIILLALVLLVATGM